jgi:hypothetical protein
MLFGETVAVYCEINTEHTDTMCGRMQRLYLTRNILRLHYNAQPVNSVFGKNRCLLSETYGSHRYTLCSECRVCTSKDTYHVFATKANKSMLFGETFAVYFENHKEHRETLFGQNVETVTHRKHITSPIKRPTG